MICYLSSSCRNKSAKMSLIVSDEYLKISTLTQPHSAPLMAFSMFMSTSYFTLETWGGGQWLCKIKWTHTQSPWWVIHQKKSVNYILLQYTKKIINNIDTLKIKRPIFSDKAKNNTILTQRLWPEMKCSFEWTLILNELGILNY